RRPLRGDDFGGRSHGTVVVVHLVHGSLHKAKCTPVLTSSSHSPTAAAHWRPSLIAHTIKDWPRRASPAAKTPSADVAYAPAFALPRRSRSTPSCSSTAGSGLRKPMASSTSCAGREVSVPAIGSNGGFPEFSTQWISSTRPSRP